MSTASEIGVYREVLVFLGTAGVVIPLMARLRVSPVVGFLVAGLVLGPHAIGRFSDTWPWLSWITITSQDAVDLLAEMGVAFLLFTIGLGLSFDRLWTMRRLVFGLGMAQVVLTTAAISAVAFAFGNTIESSLVIGACLSLSSTAVVLQLLAEQRRLLTTTGRTIFAVLLAQDLAVVPILFLIVVFGNAGAEGATAAGGMSVWIGLGLAILQAAAAIVMIVGFGRLILRRLFRLVARTHSRELFMATILFVVVGTSLMTQYAGLSMALGAFLAGQVLAETEFRRQVEVDIEPFKGMLLGLFFISVGMRIDLAEVARFPLLLAASIIGMTAMKAAVVVALARAFRLSWPLSLEASLLLAGGGEFAFLVLSLASSSGLTSHEVEQFMLLVASGTMLLTPLLARLARHAGQTASRVEEERQAPDETLPADKGRTIVVGYGRVGRLVSDILGREGRDFLTIARDAVAVRRGRASGHDVVYGDATRREFLRKCGLDTAGAVIVTIHDAATAEAVTEAVRAERPDVPIVVRACDPDHAKRLMKLGATEVVPEVLETALELAGATLQALGQPRSEVADIVHQRRQAMRAPLRPKAPAE